MRHAKLAKPEVTEVEILGLPVQSVKISLMKASIYFQPDLKLLAWLYSSVFSLLSLNLWSTLFCEPDVVSKSFGTFVNQVY